MLSIKLIVLAEIREKYFRDACDEYKKRLSAMCRLTEIIIKEEKISENPGDSEIEKALQAEEARIIHAIPPKSSHAYIIGLCVEGKQFSSEELAERFDRLISTEGISEICFIVGSSHGLSEKVKERCDLRLSLSKMTFPHTMMRPVLYEVIYRELCILSGKKYHK